MVVLPSPNHGSCHEKPSAGLKRPDCGTRLLSGWSVSGPTNMTFAVRFESQLETGSSDDCCAPWMHCNGLVALDPYPVKYKFPGVNQPVKISPLLGRPAPNKPKPSPSNV